jgi:hypothetical protein
MNQVNDAGPSGLVVLIFAGLVGLAVVVFFLGWLGLTFDIRRDVRAWREEERARHKELIDTLKKP